MAREFNIGLLRRLIAKNVVERRSRHDGVNQRAVHRLRSFAKRKDQILCFDAKDDVPYGVAAQVMDLARTGGARTISILTEKVD